jgi:hypothetical protein
MARPKVSAINEIEPKVAVELLRSLEAKADHSEGGSSPARGDSDGGSGGGGSNPRRLDETAGRWELESGRAASVQSRGEKVQQEAEYPHTRVALRNGAGEMALSKAAHIKARLEGLLRRDPALLQALRALTQDRRQEVSREQLEALRKKNFVMGSGRVPGEIQMVMQASYEEMSGTASIVEPFDAIDPTHAAVVQRYRDEEARAIGRGQAIIESAMQARNEGQERS